MSEQAQSSGHEWRCLKSEGFGCCECGWYCTGLSSAKECEEQHAAHVASVAQAVKPSANYVNDPDYQADVLLAEADALKKFTDYFVANYPGPDTIIYDPHWHAPKIFRAAKAALKLVPAQPQEVPAPALNSRQRDALSGFFERGVTTQQAIDRVLSAAQEVPAEQRDGAWKRGDWTDELVDELAQGILKAAELLCETREHIGRRPCDFCQMQIRACFPYAPPAQPQEVPAPLTPFGEELQQKSFRDGVRSLRLLVREEMDKPDHVMPHTHKPDVQPGHQWEYCWRCKIERVLDSQIEGYKVHCSHAAQEVPVEELYDSLEYDGPKGELVRIKKPASAAKPAKGGADMPYDPTTDPYAIKQERGRTEPLGQTSAAKPAKDGLEAQCRRFVLENSGYGVETLTANLAAFVRASQAARERELREKLERLLRDWDWGESILYGLDENGNKIPMRGGTECAKELRALLASHWPAQKEGK